MAGGEHECGERRFRWTVTNPGRCQQVLQSEFQVPESSSDLFARSCDPDNTAALSGGRTVLAGRVTDRCVPTSLRLR